MKWTLLDRWLGRGTLFAALAVFQMTSTSSWSEPPQGTSPAPISPESNVEEIPVETVGVSVGCSPVQLPFRGMVLYKAPRQPKRPLLDAEFWVTERGGHPPKTLEAKVSFDGHFETTLTGWDETYADESPRGRTKVTHLDAVLMIRVTAAGCKDRWLRVDRNWREKAIVLKCPSR